MSGDLISRKEVLDWMCEQSAKLDCENSHHNVLMEFEYMIANMPAFDVDKVVEQLKNEESGLTGWAEDQAYKLGLEKAVEIIKSALMQQLQEQKGKF